MQFVQGIDALTRADDPSVVTVGFFDGVHLGHRSVLDTAVARARERGLRSVGVTFDRHPREVLTPGQEPRLLTTVDRKASLIGTSGLDLLVVIGFTPAFSKITAHDFVRDVLVRSIGARHAVMGANFTFGYKAEGTVQTLPSMGELLGLTAEGVPLLELGGRVVSSSSVREALTDGELAWPVQALGRRFVLDGEVVSGHGRGKALGYPTANLLTWPRLLLPGQGIYAGIAEVGGHRYRAAVDVGTNPTFGVDPLHVEAFLLDYEAGEIRGEPLALELWERLRDEVRYDSIDELIAAIAGDVDRTREIVPVAALAPPDR
ncbi:bifunctional riboflavin kinase/FAD synthetase [soil metagenome]